MATPASWVKFCINHIYFLEVCILPRNECVNFTKGLCLYVDVCQHSPKHYIETLLEYKSYKNRDFGISGIYLFIVNIVLYHICQYYWLPTKTKWTHGNDTAKTGSFLVTTSEHKSGFSTRPNFFLFSFFKKKICVFIYLFVCLVYILTAASPATCFSFPPCPRFTPLIHSSVLVRDGQPSIDVSKAWLIKWL